MGILEAKHPGGPDSPIRLRGRTVVGRSTSSGWVLNTPKVSRSHATVWWDGQEWLVKDLGSRNGTWVDGDRLETGVNVPLLQGASVAFGHRDRLWCLIDAAPPQPCAIPKARPVVVGSDDLLLLPSEDDPRATIYRDGNGAWALEMGDEVRHVDSGATLTVAGNTYELDLPVTLARTAGDPLRTGLSCRFSVSRDQEFVELHLDWGADQAHLDGRVYLYTLMVLAQARVDDHQRPEAERGWVARGTLEQMTGLDTPTLNTQVSRARRQLARLGVPGAGEVIQRRRGQLRFNAVDIQVQQR